MQKVVEPVAVTLAAETRSGAAGAMHTVSGAQPSIVPALDALTASLAGATAAAAAMVTVFDGQNRWITMTSGTLEIMAGTDLVAVLRDACGATLNRPVRLDSPDRIDALFAHRLRIAGRLPFQLDMICMSGREGGSHGLICVFDATGNDAAGSETGLLAGFAAVVMNLLVLHDQLEDFQHIVMLSPHMSVIVDARGVVIEIAASLRALLGIDPGADPDPQYRALIHPADFDALAEAWQKALAGEIPVEVEYRLKVRDAGYRWFRTHAKPRRDASGRVMRWCALLEDVHERHEDRTRLAHLAYHDDLTGLSNRTHFRTVLEHRVDAAESAGFGVARLELHDVRAVIDTLGQPVGDRLLLQVSKRIGAGVRPGDLLAHGGGGEFLILLDGIHSVEEARAVLDDVLRTLDAPVQVEGSVVAVGASVGVALAERNRGTAPGTAAQADMLLQNSDLALLRARSAGRGEYCFYSPEIGETTRRLQALKVDLRNALEGGQLFLVYQPVVDVRTGRVTGLEALVRWNHPTRGIVPPVDFIPEAESNGLIVPIGRWVLEQACRDAARWPSRLRVSVNLSSVQIHVPGLVGAVGQALERSGLEPNRLVLEITESVPLLGEADNLATLAALRALGVRIALDDFGTGYASLAYLQCFAFDIIKIERSFVQRVLDSEEARIILRAVIRLSRSLHSISVAEGVETAEQLALLRAEGCDRVQGYLFSRPVDAMTVSGTVARLNEQAGGKRGRPRDTVAAGPSPVGGSDLSGPG